MWTAPNLKCHLFWVLVGPIMLKRYKKSFYSQIFYFIPNNFLGFLCKTPLTKKVKLCPFITSCFWGPTHWEFRKDHKNDTDSLSKWSIIRNIGGLGKLRGNFIKFVVPLWSVKNYWEIHEVLRNGKGLKKIGQRYNCKSSSPFVTGIAVKNSQT